MLKVNFIDFICGADKPLLKLLLYHFDEGNVIVFFQFLLFSFTWMEHLTIIS